MNFWSELSLDRAPWLVEPFNKLKIGLTYLIIFLGGSIAGLSLAIAEGLKRSELLGPIDPHAFLFFIIGVPVGFMAGITLYPLFSYLFRWRKLVKSVKKEFGCYVVLLNLDKEPYAELKAKRN